MSFRRTAASQPHSPPPGHPSPAANPHAAPEYDDLVLSAYPLLAGPDAHAAAPEQDMSVDAADLSAPTVLADDAPDKVSVVVTDPNSPISAPSHAAATSSIVHSNTTTPNPFASSLSRDAMLAYAYHLYDSPTRPLASGLTSVPLTNPLAPLTSSEEVYRLRLLPLLITLRSLHPNDLAIMLLLACTYHALGDYDACLSVSQELLRIEPTFVEAMNNIGTTMKALGRHEQAYEWWWKAIRTRPTYWDAIDSLLGFLFTLAHEASAQDKQRSILLYSRALDVCSFVQECIYGHDGTLSIHIPQQELPRFQKVLLTTATIQSMDSSRPLAPVQTFFKAIELVISPPQAYHTGGFYTARDLILASYLAAFLIQSASSGPLPNEVTLSLGLPAETDANVLLDSGADLFGLVRLSGDRFVTTLLHHTGNTLPFVLLLPDQAARLPLVLFPVSKGVLPAICTPAPGTNKLRPPPEGLRQQANVMTSTVLLALAKRYQDMPSAEAVIPGFEGKLNVNHSLAMMFYYLALAFSPSPSTYNNMGIILSTMSLTMPYVTEDKKRVTLSGSSLARMYYAAGLQLDPTHPHLLTNLGSLYKDQGNLEEAIQLYAKAIAVKPDFDVALANMGNAVKDTGRSWEALEYYRRAVEQNPDLPEAVCGLMSSMAAVCDWRGRDSLTGAWSVDDDGNFISPASPDFPTGKYMRKMIEICEGQLRVAYVQNIHAVSATKALADWIDSVQTALGRSLRPDELSSWRSLIGQFYEPLDRTERRINEGGFVIRFINWLQPRLQRRWYIKSYGSVLTANPEDIEGAPEQFSDEFRRPALPRTMSPPVVPSILPFNTFIYPLSPRMIRLISHRNALRISFTALSQPWLPQNVYPPPPPPGDGILNIGYVSNDVNNHPLSHLMQSVFGMHDRKRVRVFVYTTSPWDGTSYRPRISSDVEVFVDASTWSTERIVQHIILHKIHILINLGGYTKGARNDLFAARPCPVQMQLMGYAGTLGAGWCDYLVCDPIACPRDMCASELWRIKRREGGASHDDFKLDLDADPDPEGYTDDWVFSEKFVYMPHTLMVTDHRQSFRMDENLSPEERANTPVDVLWRNEERRRMDMRRAIFPDLPQDTIIFANFNQLYKIDPGVYAVWLRILTRIPNSILWLLRFPAAGEEHLRRTAVQWAGEEVASRIRFTEVARKDVHVYRGRVADLFLDTIECNAHTIAGDVLWAGTPILTLPMYRHKMCSRVAAGMANATGFGDQMVVSSLDEYESRAIALANSVQYVPETDEEGTTIMRGQGELFSLRRNLYLNRDRMPLFDTARWTRNIEKAYWEAWRRWVEGTQFEMSDEWEACNGPEKESGAIWVTDDEPVDIARYD